MRESFRRLCVVLAAGAIVVGPISGSAGAGATSDTTPPVVSTVGPTVRYNLTEHGTSTFSWTIFEENTLSDVFAYLQAGHAGDVVPLNYTELAPATEGSWILQVAPGWTSCLLTVAYDGDLNRGMNSPAPCVAAPVDDANLSKSVGWKTKAGSGNYHGTITSTSTKGSVIELHDASFTHGAIVVTKCPGCGRIAIDTFDHHSTHSLDAATTKKKQLIKFALPPEYRNTSATISVKVLSEGKPVKIDGIAALDQAIGYVYFD